LEKFSHSHVQRYSESADAEEAASVRHEHGHAEPSTKLSGLLMRDLCGLPPPVRHSWSTDHWSDARGCTCRDHEHVHAGVRHKSVQVGSGASTMPLVLALLFSVHSFIAGLALGIQSRFGSSAVAILVAILAHKFVEALALASSFVKEGVATSTSLPLLLIYCTMTPAGVLVGAYIIGHALGPSAAAAEALVSGFAAGSFVFLAGHELAHSRNESPIGKLRGSFLALIGFASMALLSFWI